MVVHRASSDRSRRSSSPTTPLSPSSLPQWLLPSKATVAVLPPGRVKLLLLALICMILGWSITSKLSPDLRDAQPFDNGSQPPVAILGHPIGLDNDTSGHITQHFADPAAAPSIKDALGNLHKAVTGKISGWGSHATPVSPDAATHNTDEEIAAVDEPFSSTSEHIHDGQSDDERLGARTRIGKCTILFNGNDLWERAIRTHESHDRIHGYRLHVLRQHLLDDVWSKPAYILSLILRELAKPESERLEWLFWVDADTILLNPYIPIETFLPPPGPEFEHIHLLYSNDWNGLNNGVFPIRVNRWSVDLLTTILAFRYFRPDDPLIFRDQSAMDSIMKEPKFVSNIIQLPQRWFNAYQGEHNETLAPYQIRRGDLLVHFAGVINRNDRMAFWLDRAEQHMEDWEVPYKSTSYPEEVKEFWTQQRAEREGKKQELVRTRLAATELMSKVSRLIDEVGHRLPVDQLEIIKKHHSDMADFLGNSDKSEDLNGLNLLKGQLETTIEPLESARKDGHKALLTSAHDAMFAAEKELLLAGFYNGIINPEALEVDNAIKQVKELILDSENGWDRERVTAAVDKLTNTRLKHKDRLLELELVAKQKAEQDKLDSSDPEVLSRPADGLPSHAGHEDDREHDRTQHL